MQASPVKVVDGIVQPARPIVQAIADAIQFLRRADGQYVPGRTDGPDLAGYFSSALVKPDGSRSERALFFPARQHAYFIRVFLRYYEYTGEREWLLRARDLADWNIAHSTPKDCAYPNLSYSAWQNGKPTGSQDKDSTEPDKAAFIATYYIALFEATGEARYLDAARLVAETLLPRQREDGSWPFRVIPETGAIYEDLGGAPVYYVEFFERLQRHENKPAYRAAHDKALRLMIARNVEQGQWGTYHEDIRPKDGTHLSAEPMSFTADYLFRKGREHPEYVEFGRRVLRQMEEKLVHTTGHAAAPAAAVAEQATFAHIMPGHTARYCLALSNLYKLNRDEALRRGVLSSLSAVTYMQSEIGLFRTYFFDVKRNTNKDGGRPNWYSQHLYTVCHALECMTAFPELASDGKSRILGASASLHDVRYDGRAVAYGARLPATVMVKLQFEPASVQLGGRSLQKASAPAIEAGTDGWSWDAAARVLLIRGGAGLVTVKG